MYILHRAASVSHCRRIDFAIELLHGCWMGCRRSAVRLPWTRWRWLHVLCRADRLIHNGRQLGLGDFHVFAAFFQLTFTGDTFTVSPRGRLQCARTCAVQMGTQGGYSGANSALKCELFLSGGGAQFCIDLCSQRANDQPELRSCVRRHQNARHSEP